MTEGSEKAKSTILKYMVEPGILNAQEVIKVLGDCTGLDLCLIIYWLMSEVMTLRRDLEVWQEKFGMGKKDD
jgi:hypothetical protein